MRAIMWAGLLVAVAAAINGCSGSSSAQGTIADQVDGIAIGDIAPLGDGRIVFAGFKGNEGGDYEPWVSDGTPKGTQLLLEIFPGPDGSIQNAIDYTMFVVIDGTAYFVANDGTNGTALWRTDGTPAGTTMILMLVPAPLWLGMRSIHADGNRVYVAGYSYDPFSGDFHENHLFSVTVD